MTRPIRFRSVSWFGEDGEPSTFVAVPPVGFERYRVTGMLRVQSHARPPDLEVVTISDPETGAVVEVRGSAATVSLSGDASPQYLTRLWRDARDLTGMVRRLGRPPGQTNIENDEQILSVVRLMRRDGRRVTQATVAATSGRFSPENLRYYLRVTGRTWQEFLHTS